MYYIEKDNKFWTGTGWATSKAARKFFCTKWEASAEKTGGEIKKF